MTPLATLVLTGIDLVEEIQRRRANEPSKPTHRTRMAEVTLEDFRAALASTIREGRDVTPQEMTFWLDRINQDRATLREIANRSEPQSSEPPDDETRRET
jgi:hypothetical protein